MLRLYTNVVTRSDYMNTFLEIQRIHKMFGYWFVATPLVGLGVWGLIYFIRANDENQINATLIILCSAPILLSIFYFSVNLKTDYNEIEIKISYFPIPFFKRRILWNTINKAYVRKFDWSEFKATGVGMIPFGSGKAYHLFSEYGLQLETINGEKILIGTRKPKSLQEFLKRINKL